MAEIKIEISKEGYLELISKVFNNKEEERELALDRYRIADGEMKDATQFVALGKNAVAFLDLAAKSSNTMAEIAKEIRSIVFKDSDGTGTVNIHLNDDFKKLVNNEIEKKEKEQTKKSLDSDSIISEETEDDKEENRNE